MDRRVALGLVPAAIAGLAFFAYAGALDNALLGWDDDVHVTDNPHVKSLRPSTFVWMLTTFTADNWHPLAWLSHSVDYALFGMDPWGHHLASVLIHCASSIWFFLLGIAILQLCADPTRSPSLLGRAEPPLVAAAGVAALLLGVHPQHVESVAWVAERKDVLCLFFVLPTLLAYLYYATAPTPVARRRWYAACVACFLGAVLSKPQAVTVPAILLILDAYPLRRIGEASGQRAGWRTLAVEKLPFLAGALLLAALTLQAQTHALAGTGQVGMGFRVLNAFQGLVHYPSKLAVPFELYPFYPRPTSYRGFFHNLGDYLPAIAVVVVTTLFCVVQWARRRPWWLAAWVFYGVTLAPVIGLIQVGDQIAADRYAYLPLLPVYLLIGVGVSRLAGRGPALRVAIAGLLIAVAGGLVHLTRQQTQVWASDISFWEYLVTRYPDRHLVQSALGFSYLNADALRAIPHMRRAIELDPEHFGDRYNLGWAYQKLGRLEEADAVFRAMLRDGIVGESGAISVRLQIGAIACERGMPAEVERFAGEVQTLDRRNPDAAALLAALREGRCR